MEKKDCLILVLALMTIISVTSLMYVSSEYRIENLNRDFEMKEMNRTTYDLGKQVGRENLFWDVLINGQEIMPLLDANGTINGSVAIYSINGCIGVCQNLGCQLVRQ